MPATVAFTEAGGGAIDRPEPEALVARAALGDGEAFGDLFGAYAGPVTRLCRRMLGSDEDAKDARSEVFLRAREALAGYDPRRSFRSWLLAIAAHHCIDQLRRRAVEGRLFDAADLAEDTLPSAAPSPLGSALARERRDQLLAALDALAAAPPRAAGAALLRGAALRRDGGAARRARSRRRRAPVPREAAPARGAVRRRTRMSCPPEWWVAAYVDEGIEPAEVRRLEAHLVGCERCRGRVLALREEARALTALLAEDRAAPRPALALAGATPARGMAYGLPVAIAVTAARDRGRRRP